MTWATYQISWDVITRHALDYDPRKDADHVRPHGITRCGRKTREDRRLDIPRDKYPESDCDTCNRLTKETKCQTNHR